MPVTVELDKHQEEAISKLVAAEGGIAWIRVGEGKTRVALVAAYEIAPVGAVIIIVARRAAFYDWEQEIATLQLAHEILTIEQIKPREDFSDRSAIIFVSDGRLINSNVLDRLSELHVSAQIGTIIADELWLFKNPKAKKHLALRRFAEYHPTIGLSGSAMTARDITDIYGAVAAVGRAKVLGRTLTNFRTRFQMNIQGGFQTWYPKPGAYKEIMDAIAPFTYVYMPPIARVKGVQQIIKVKPTDQQLALIKELKETAAIEGAFELTSMGSIVTKAQQISNGWIQNDDGTVTDIESTKVDRCVALAEELMQAEYKVVIWCAFRHDIERLMPEMLKVSKKVATLQGGQDFDVKLWKDPKCRICLATEASGSSINHFAQVPYAIYFSQDFKWTSLQQSQGRHTRRSSDHDTAYFLFLHTEKTLDAQVHYTVRHSASSERSFLKQIDVQAWINAH